jgi:nucleotide-binding universal stress UspA family protein
LDGSQRAEQAIPLAARLARASGGSLFLVQVVNTIREFAAYSPRAILYFQELSEKERADARDYLAGIAALSEFAGLEVLHAVVSGDIAPSLLQMIQRERIDLIVLCSHGYTGLKRWALGSVAQKVVRQSPVPVFLLREQRLQLQDKVVQPVRAAVALDGSPFAEAALLPTAHLVAALSSPAEAELLLLQVAQMPTEQEERECQQRGLDVDLRKVTLLAADNSLRAARATLLQEFTGKQRVHVAWSVLEDGDTADALIQAAEVGKGSGIRQTSDLLALTTHGRAGIQRWVLGSVTERVLQGSTLPLFIVHPQEAVSLSVAK